MKVARYYGRKDIRIEEMPVPDVRDGEILVEMKACGICGSDLMDWYLETRAPLVLGHEPCGLVAKKGIHVKNFDIGERVFVHHHVGCLRCYYCLHGDYTLCEQFHRTNIKPGGFAEYFVVPMENLQLDTLKIPEGLSEEEATFIEPVGCCAKALRECNVQVGDCVTVIGAGTTGLIHVALSKIFGADKVIVSDLIDFRLNAARKMGANAIINPKNENPIDRVRSETDGRGADIVVVTAPTIEAYKTGITLCRRGGKLSVFAPTDPGRKLQISPNELFFSEIQIIPSYSTSHLETRLAFQLIQSKKIDTRNLVTHRFRLTETAEAFRVARESSESLKTVILNQ